MTTVTIPRKITRGEELIVIPRREYEKFLALAEGESREKVSEADLLRWSREARKLKKAGKLPVLRSLRDLR